MTNPESHRILRDGPAEYRMRLSWLHTMLADAACEADALHLFDARDSIRSAIKSAASESMEIAETTFRRDGGE